jgi:hypothetical protein
MLFVSEAVEENRVVKQHGYGKEGGRNLIRIITKGL